MSKEQKTTAIVDLTLRIIIDKYFSEDEDGYYLELSKSDKITEDALHEYILDCIDSSTRHTNCLCWGEVDFKIVEPIKYLDGKPRGCF